MGGGSRNSNGMSSRSRSSAGAKETSMGGGSAGASSGSQSSAGEGGRSQCSAAVEQMGSGGAGPKGGSQSIAGAGDGSKDDSSGSHHKRNYFWCPVVDCASGPVEKVTQHLSKVHKMDAATLHGRSAEPRWRLFGLRYSIAR